MIVPEYEAKFVDLARYALQVIATAWEKARKFQEGLGPWIKSILVPLMIEDHGDAFWRAMEIEDNSVQAT